MNTKNIRQFPLKRLSVAFAMMLITATAWAENVDLSTVTINTTLNDGDVVTGTLDVANYPVKITIADGAKVTLSGVTINGVDNISYWWAGITCAGNATILLADGTTNTVKGFSKEYPGIFVPEDKTLTITVPDGADGTGILYVSSNGKAPGIGGVYCLLDCGNITIEGGVIHATGGTDAAGIGGGAEANCGNITISSGDVTAQGGNYAAGIGAGQDAGCGLITISGGEVTATGGDYGAGIGTGGNTNQQPHCSHIVISGGTVHATGGSRGTGIGAGYRGWCGNITISGGNVTATGKDMAAAIGSSVGGGSSVKLYSSCGDITITSGVSSLILTKNGAYNFMGKGSEKASDYSNSGTVTFDDLIYFTNGGTQSLFGSVTNAVATQIAGKPVNFKRQFTSGVASTICLPFSVDFFSPGNSSKFYTFVGVNAERTEVTMEEANVAEKPLAANTPYLFMPAATGAVTFSGTAPASAANIEADVTDITDWTFTGTYAEKRWDDTHNTAEIGTIYGFASGQGYEGSLPSADAGTFIRLTTGGIKPFRAYLKYTGASLTRGVIEELPEQMTVVLVGSDGQKTAIGTIDTRTGEVTTGSWYSLSGRQLNGKPSAKGVYINNGRKVVIK